MLVAVYLLDCTEGKHGNNGVYSAGKHLAVVRNRFHSFMAALWPLTSSLLLQDTPELLNRTSKDRKNIFFSLTIKKPQKSSSILAAIFSKTLFETKAQHVNFSLNS